jgi:hypothetical protein
LSVRRGSTHFSVQQQRHACLRLCLPAKLLLTPTLNPHLGRIGGVSRGGVVKGPLALLPCRVLGLLRLLALLLLLLLLLLPVRSPRRSPTWLLLRLLLLLGCRLLLLYSLSLGWRHGCKHLLLLLFLLFVRAHVQLIAIHVHYRPGYLIFAAFLVLLLLLLLLLLLAATQRHVAVIAVTLINLAGKWRILIAVTHAPAIAAAPLAIAVARCGCGGCARPAPACALLAPASALRR